MTQIPLVSTAKDRHAANMQRRRRAIAALGAKQVAAAFGVTEQALSHMMAERGRHWPSWADEVLLELDPTDAMDEVLESQAERRGKEIVDQVEVTDADEVSAWRDVAAEEFGQTTRGGIVAKVRERARENARRRSR